MILLCSNTLHMKRAKIHFSRVRVRNTYKKSEKNSEKNSSLCCSSLAGLGCHLGEIGKMIHRMDGALFHFEAMEGLAIAEEQELGLQGGMVTEGLLQHGLSEGDTRGLAFHNHQWTAFGAKHHGIGTLVQAVHLDGILHRHQACRHVQMLHQEVQHLLPHLLLGRQRDETGAQGVEDGSFSIAYFCTEPLYGLFRHDCLELRLQR